MITLKNICFFLTFLFFSVCFSFLVPGYAEKVPSTGKLTSIVHQKMKQYDVKPSQVLFAIGLDRVIYHPTYAPFQVQNLYKHSKILDEIGQQLSEEQRYCLYNLFTKKGPLETIESRTPEIISSLQGEGIKFLGLVAYLVGPFYSIESHERWADRVLTKQFNINFSNAFEVKELEFREESPYRGRFPLYYNGVLYANGRGEKGSKGLALVAFLKYLDKHEGYIPALIFIMDDIETHLKLANEEVNKYNPNIHVVELPYTFRETCYPDKLIDAETFRKAWSNLATEIKTNKVKVLSF